MSHTLARSVGSQSVRRLLKAQVSSWPGLVSCGCGCRPGSWVAAHDPTSDFDECAYHGALVFGHPRDRDHGWVGVTDLDVADICPRVMLGDGCRDEADAASARDECEDLLNARSLGSYP